MEYALSPEMVEQLRTDRASVYDQALGLVEKWRDEAKSFDEVYRYEVESVGRTLLGEGEIRPSYVYMWQLEGSFRRAGVAEEDAAVTYPRLPAFRHPRPQLRTSALGRCCGHQSRAVSSLGRVKPPTQGLVTDIRMVSGLLPYCDAMLVDGEIAGYLRNEPLASSVGVYAKVFSSRTLEELIVYLRGIEQSATAEHLALVEEVYGPIAGSFVEHQYRRENGAGESSD